MKPDYSPEILGVSNANPAVSTLRRCLRTFMNASIILVTASPILPFSNRVAYFAIQQPHTQLSVTAMAASASGAERAAQLAAAERQLLDDVPLIPLYFYVSKHLDAPRVGGWYDNVMNVVYSKDLSLQQRVALRRELRASHGLTRPAIANGARDENVL